MYIVNAFVSGVLFYVDLFVSSWWWIFLVLAFGGMCYLDNKEIEETYIDDDRTIL